MKNRHASMPIKQQINGGLGVKHLLRDIWGFVLITVILISLGFGYLAWRIVNHENILSESHVAQKQAYLEEIATLPQLTPDQVPNLVVILFDDMGYGDIGAYGSRLIKTPHLDKAAASGLMMTQGFSAAPYCTPARAGLLTGRMAGRMNLNQVTFPHNSAPDWIARLSGTGTAMPQDEITIAEILRARGYRTHMIGKWHLGDAINAQPIDFGFESFFGVLFSNDMAPFHLYRNRDIVRPHPFDQSSLTRDYTNAATKFIAEQGEQPFFLYFAHSFPHIPLYADTEHKGQSAGGLYGDVIEDLDRSVGAVTAALEQAGVADNTLILITSDNGPWYQGSAGPVRGRKNETFEGGMRVPFMLIWPDKIPPMQSDQMVIGTDLFPTMLTLTDTPAPADRNLDGLDMSPLFDAPDQPIRDSLLLEKAGVLEAIRTSTHKFRDDRPIWGGTSLPNGLAIAPKRGAMLFDLQNDPYESYDITDANPTLRHELETLLRAAQSDWDSNRRGWRN